MTIIKPTGIHPGINRRLRNLSHAALKMAQRFVPAERGRPRSLCRCGALVEVPWHKTMDIDGAPIGFEDGSEFRLESVELLCPRCGQKNKFSFPSGTLARGRLNVFGDESTRDLVDKKIFLYVYALVGFAPDKVSHYQDILNKMKLSLRPQVDPSSWTFHAAEVRNETLRRKLGIDLSIQRINDLFIDLSKQLGNDHESRYISATVAPARRRNVKKFEQLVKEETLAATLFANTDILTLEDLNIDYIFESQGSDHENNGIDWFVERVSRSLFMSFAFHFAMRGKSVRIPVTQPKGTHFELEYADFIAWLVTRYFAKLDNSQEPDFPLEPLGLMYWICLKDRTVKYGHATGFQWDLYYPENQAEKKFI